MHSNKILRIHIGRKYHHDNLTTTSRRHGTVLRCHRVWLPGGWNRSSRWRVMRRGCHRSRHVHVSRLLHAHRLLYAGGNPHRGLYTLYIVTDWRLGGALYLRCLYRWAQADIGHHLRWRRASWLLPWWIYCLLMYMYM